MFRFLKLLWWSISISTTPKLYISAFLVQPVSFVLVVGIGSIMLFFLTISTIKIVNISITPKYVPWDPSLCLFLSSYPLHSDNHWSSLRQYTLVHILKDFTEMEYIGMHSFLSGLVSLDVIIFYPSGLSFLLLIWLY